MNLSTFGYETSNDHSDGNHDHKQLLRDIEEISKALYLPKPSPKNLISPYNNSRSKSAERTRFSESKSSGNAFQKHKKSSSSSLWNWKKALKALAHSRHQRFDICFYLHVHSIQGLPPNFDDISLCVHWKRKDEELQTLPSTVMHGVVEFEETLMHKCCIYGNRSGTRNSAKYESKLSLIYVSVVGDLENDIGKHWIDLTKLLPLTLEELEGQKSSGKWTTSFKLAGNAKGATLNVSIGFTEMTDNLVHSTHMNFSDLIDLEQKRSTTSEFDAGFGLNNGNRMLRRLRSVPSNVNHRFGVSSSSVDVKVYQEASPIMKLELSESVNFLYAKLYEGNLHDLEDSNSQPGHAEPLHKNRLLDSEYLKDGSGSESDYAEFDVIEQGIEMSRKEESKQKEFHTDDSEIEIINVDEIIKDINIAVDGEIDSNSKESTSCVYINEVPANDENHGEDRGCTTRSSMEVAKSAVGAVLVPELANLHYPPATDEFLNHMEVKSNYRATRVSKKSLSMDDITESVAIDFLNMLGIEHAPNGSSSDNDPESPRERLLKEFERETLDSSNFILGFNEREDPVGLGCVNPVEFGCGNSYKDFDLVPFVKINKEELKDASQGRKNRKKPNSLEDLETKALMREWGLNEAVFQSSPHYRSDGFGSPIELPPENPFKLTPLGDGFGPYLKLKSGGSLRTMSASLFRNSKNIGSLIVQVSRALVLPADMGSDIVDILQHMASVGISKLASHITKLMPLEDITGKTLQQVAQEAEPKLTMPDRQESSGLESLLGQDSFDKKDEDGSFRFGWNYDNMSSNAEASEMESGYVSLKDFPSSAIDRIEALLIEGLRIQSGMSSGQAPSCIRTNNIEKKLGFDFKTANVEQDADFGGLMDLSISLDEWLKIDGGFASDEDHISEHRVKILMAHHAKCKDLENGTLTGSLTSDKASGETHGLLGNKLTVAVMMLLRDPLRNYEPVGTSMLALFEGERALFSQNFKMHSTMLDRSEGKDNDTDLTREKGSPLFKIFEVHLAGVKTNVGKTELWGSKAPQQSGTRWLLASGLGKSNKFPISKSKAIVVSHPQGIRKADDEDLFWSITSNAHDTDPGWNDLAKLTPYVRNPDVVFPTKVSTQL